jgi:ubiquinone/menaquinone biosynthesis C-methylase UbiE
MQAGSSVDAIVCLDRLRGVPAGGARAGFLAEVVRVLKPGAPFIFVERGPQHTAECISQQYWQ